MFRNLISTCIVLLIILQLVAGQKDGEAANQEFKTFDEWALGYEPEEDPERHRGYLRDSIHRALRKSEEEDTVIPAFEVVAKIRNQRQDGEVIQEFVYETQQNIRNIVAESGCEVTSDSDYLSLSGSVRNIFYASVVCTERDRYNALVDNHGFWSNVLFMRATDFLSTGIKDVISLNPNFNPTNDWAIPMPWIPDAPINPCSDYTTTPWRNWYADAMHGGKIDCQLLTDDCEYNKGRGGHLIMIDSGLSNHPELNPLVAAGKISQRHFFSSPELAITDPYLDVMGHGTSLASLAVGKYIGIVKQATLESIKVTIDSNSKVSINAVVSAVNKIIQEQTTKGKNRIKPTVIFGGMSFTWTEKELCYIAYINNPSESISIANARRLMKMNANEERAPSPATPPSLILPLTPLPWSVDPPTTYSGGFGYNTYDCAYTVVNAIRNVISVGIPYLVPTANGAMYYDLITGEGFAGGFDRCFATRWLNSVPACMQADEYLYSPLFMVSGYRSHPSDWGNSGSINRAILIGGYGKDFKNAKWNNVYIVDNTTEDNFLDMGGANYGSQWNLYNEGERCVDYAAPAADFENLPLSAAVNYGSWGYSGFNNGINFGYYGIPQAPMSGTSYATPLAAGSILETLIRHWSTLRPSAYFPDYTFGEKVVNAVDANNVIMNAGSGLIKITNDQSYVDMYDFFSYWVSAPVPVQDFNCAYKYGNYYVNDAFPSNVAEINVPHNRNLFMPKYRSSENHCAIPVATPGGNNPASREI